MDYTYSFKGCPVWVADFLPKDRLYMMGADLSGLVALDLSVKPPETTMLQVASWLHRANSPWRNPIRAALADKHAKSKAYALKNVRPCRRCGKYSYHLIDCTRAKSMDVMYRNYIPKSWEPDVPERGNKHHPGFAITSTGDGWCPDCKHHRGDHINGDPDGYGGGNHGHCVLARCYCKRHPDAITPEVKMDPLTKEPICEAGYTNVKPGQRLGLVHKGKLYATIKVAEESKPFTITVNPWKS
jgi:hypothetical protein